MASGMVCIIFIAMLASVASASAAGSPVSKVFELLADLRAKIVKEGEEAQQTYDEFSTWCGDRSKNIGFEIKTGKSDLADMSATIEKETATIAALGTKIEELAASLASDDADLKAATEIRNSDAAEFDAEEKETVEVISALERAIAILNRDSAKGSGSMLQLKDTQNIVQAFSTMVQASVLSVADAKRLTALVQSNHDSENGEADAALGAPDPQAYKFDRGGIIGALTNLLEKAEAQLENARTKEAKDRNSYELLRQSLQGEIDAAQKDMDEAKRNLASSEEAKATAEGDLSVTASDLKQDQETLASLKQDCTTGAEDFQAESTNRAQELKALDEATKILGDALPAAAHTYGAALDQDQATLFLQLSRSELHSGTDLAKFEAVRFIRDLARKENSVGLAQLASRISSVIRYGASVGSDPLSKVRSLISDMIASLEKDAAAALKQQAFCDKETSETTAKKAEKTNAIKKLSTQMDFMSAKSGKLKEQTATLQRELGELTASQSEMDKIRLDEKALFAKSRAEMQTGIAGVQKAVGILRDYYSQEDKQEFATQGSEICKQLETVESDFTKGLSEMQAAESSADMEYQKTSELNTAAKSSKESDLQYKTKEALGLDKSLTESASDKDGVQAELDALQQYLGKLGKMCIGKASTFADRRSRRDAEIAGLKEALSIIEGEAVLLQVNDMRSFRGKRAQAKHSIL